MDYCPEARCEVSEVCRPCDRRFLFEIALGRSGSTSLFDAINLLPGIRLSGENNGMMLGLIEIIDRLEEGVWWNRTYGMGTMLHSFSHNYIPEGSFACPAQRFVDALDPPDRTQNIDDSKTILGFKTIRMHKWLTIRYKDVTREKLFWRFNLVLKLFPCSRFIINIRSDVSAQYESMKREFHDAINHSPEDFQMRNQMLNRLAEHLGQKRAYLMYMEQWDKDPKYLQRMARWLGYRNCNFTDSIPHDNKASEVSEEILTEKTGYFNDVKSSSRSLGDKCRYVGAH